MGGEKYILKLAGKLFLRSLFGTLAKSQSYYPKDYLLYASIADLNASRWL